MLTQERVEKLKLGGNGPFWGTFFRSTTLVTPANFVNIVPMNFCYGDEAKYSRRSQLSVKIKIIKIGVYLQILEIIE